MDTDCASLPAIACAGILFCADAHLAGTPPGQRLPGYTEQTLAKLAFCLNQAAARNLLPVICGDLFHWPRENPNTLLVRCIELFKPLASTPLKCWVLVGNHDKWQANYTDDVSMAVLESAGVIHVMKDAGPQCRVLLGGGDGGDGHVALLGASPDMTPLPKAVERGGADTVLWVSHHGLGFPDYADQRQPLRELPGVDWLINGHLHQPQPPQRRGMTTWVNLGSLTRMSFAPRVRERRPAAAIWRPGMTGLERLDVPFLPFEDVFPDQPFPDTQIKEGGESLFLRGLERLVWKRTREGAGLGQFLSDNLDPALPESQIILSLYEEIIHGGAQQD